MHNTAAHGPLNDNHENQQSIGRWDFVAWTERVVFCQCRRDIDIKLVSAPLI